MQKLMEGISTKMDIIAGTLNKIPLLEEKHDTYVKELTRVVTLLESTDKRLITIIERVENDAKSRHEQMQARVHDRLDQFKKVQDDTTRRLDQYKNVAVGVWIAASAIFYLLGDRPIRAIESWKEGIEAKINVQGAVLDNHDRRFDELKLKGR